MSQEALFSLVHIKRVYTKSDNIRPSVSLRICTEPLCFIVKSKEAYPVGLLCKRGIKCISYMSPSAKEPLSTTVHAKRAISYRPHTGVAGCYVAELQCVILECRRYKKPIISSVDAIRSLSYRPHTCAAVCCSVLWCAVVCSSGLSGGLEVKSLLSLLVIYSLFRKVGISI